MVQKIKQHPLEVGSSMWHSRNIFLLIFNLIGISFIDLALLTEDNIQNDRIVFILDVVHQNEGDIMQEKDLCHI